MEKNITNNGFVALFDILGFKSLREKLGTYKLAEKYEYFASTTLEYAAANSIDIKNRKPLQNEFSCEKRIFSDTVLFIRQNNTLNDLIAILLTSYYALGHSLSGSKMALRGAIGYGDIYVNGDIIVGSAVEDAAQYYEKQNWAGCMLTLECQKFITEKSNYLSELKRCKKLAESEPNEENRNKYNLLANLIVPYDIPNKIAELNHCYRNYLAINWPMKIINTDFNELNAFYETDNEDAKIKQVNTEVFWNYIKKRK